MFFKVVLPGIFFLALLAVVEGQYEDVRCKCVCPSVQLPNSTESSRRVFVNTFKEPGRCKCENVVDKALIAEHENFCARCECQWQRRNTTTIKGIVILVIVVIGILVLYMLFLLCLDPLLSRKHGAAYSHLHLETAAVEPSSDTQSVTTTERVVEDGASTSARARPGTLVSRVKHEVNRVKGEQQKWKGTVQEQRRNIYDRHSMLN